MEELFVCLKACQLIYKLSVIEQRLVLVLYGGTDTGTVAPYWALQDLWILNYGEFFQIACWMDLPWAWNVAFLKKNKYIFVHWQQMIQEKALLLAFYLAEHTASLYSLHYRIV